MSDDTFQVRLSIYIDTQNMLRGRIDLAERAFANYTQLYEAYLNGTPIFRYQFQDEHRDNNIFITPRPLLRQSLFRTAYTRKYSSRVGSDINDIKAFLEMYTALANTSYVNGTVDEDVMYYINVQFLRDGRQFYQAKSEFYAESIEYPYRFLQQRIDDLDRHYRRVITNLDELTSGVVTLQTNLDVLENSILARLENVFKVAQLYIDHGNQTKLKVKFTLSQFK